MYLEGRKLTDIYSSKDLEVVTYDIKMAMVYMYSWLEGGEIDSHTLQQVINVFTSLTSESILADTDNCH